MKQNRKGKFFSIIVFSVVVIIFIIVTLADFYTVIQSRVYDMHIKSMEELAMEGSVVVEKNLESMENTLYGLAEYMEKDDIGGEKNIQRLREFQENRKGTVRFVRMGLADIHGDAWVTNGERLNISEREYFQKCIKEHNTNIELKQSVLIDEPIMIIAVPILDDDEESCGVLYGVIELDTFKLYENTTMEGEKQFVQLIDEEGNYILKEPSSLLGRRENIFDGLSHVESKNRVEEIKEKVQNDERVFTEVWGEGKEEILFFSPLKINDWCVVTIMDKSSVTGSVDYILDDDVYILTLKVALLVFALGLVILYHVYREKKWIEEFNKQIIFNEQVFKLAAEKAQMDIAIYNLKTRKLRFINNTISELQFPQELDHADTDYITYIPENPELRRQMKELFRSLEKNHENREVYISFQGAENERYFRLQLTFMPDEQGSIQNCVGFIEDFTEQMQLKKEANTDILTGLYNRRSGIRLINDCMKNTKLNAGEVHACMLMDLDHFKVLNDTLGHQVGDVALQDVARILKQHFRDYDILCRIGGDEFLMFLKSIPENVIERNVTSLLKKIHLSYGSGEKQVDISASVGIVLVRDGEYNFTEIYHQADEALYEVKNGQRNGFKIYGK